MTIPLTLRELLIPRGLPADARTKLIRHQDPRCDMRQLREDGFFEAYQQYQSRPVLECDYLVSFIGDANSTAVLHGVYSVGERRSSAEFALPLGAPEFIYPGEDGFHYDLQRVPSFDELVDRVVIAWGESSRSWHQWLDAKRCLLYTSDAADE